MKKIPQSNGVIALHENHQDEDRAKADLLMRSNCGNKPVEVLEEGEVVTGTQTNSNAKKTNELENQGGFQFGAVRFGGSDENAEKTATQATQTNLKEWQIRYQCAIPEVSAKASATSKKAVHK